jgi:hypothetical protein
MQLVIVLPIRHYLIPRIMYPQAKLPVVVVVVVAAAVAAVAARVVGVLVVLAVMVIMVARVAMVVVAVAVALAALPEAPVLVSGHSTSVAKRLLIQFFLLVLLAQAAMVPMAKAVLLARPELVATVTVVSPALDALVMAAQAEQAVPVAVVKMVPTAYRYLMCAMV